MRLLVGDRREPYYYNNDELDIFYDENGGRFVEEAAIECLYSWAGEMAYEEGAFSAQGISVNGPAMAAEKNRRADMIATRMGWVIGR